MKLCQGTLPKFYQGHQNITLLNVALTGQTQYGNTLMNALQQQQQRLLLFERLIYLASALCVSSFGTRALLRSWAATILMAARRGRGKRGNHMGDHDFRDERDEEIQALRRQVEQLTLHLKRQEARSESGGSSSDEGEVNPFGHYRRNYHDSFKVALPEFHGRFHPVSGLVPLRSILTIKRHQQNKESRLWH
ncbi:unnamed protein product [Prunus armeniaca]|uniref:Uncharacterized protein n=1 Tax=Prunus armeniaca TaxID=36596 RepID=A0A6J5XGN1_PRUAR|nr:unnamed protein product [Prunus armeniaca]CAB4312121.1 unnamed protein product [Prunus armeniaca]